jgi:hypothetical protein
VGYKKEVVDDAENGSMRIKVGAVALEPSGVRSYSYCCKYLRNSVKLPLVNPRCHRDTPGAPGTLPLAEYHTLSKSCVGS